MINGPVLLGDFILNISDISECHDNAMVCNRFTFQLAVNTHANKSFSILALCFKMHNT